MGGFEEVFPQATRFSLRTIRGVSIISVCSAKVFLESSNYLSFFLHKGVVCGLDCPYSIARVAGVVRPLSCRPHYSCVLQTTLVGPAQDNSTVLGAVPASGMVPEPSESLACVLRRRPHTANGGAVDDEGGTSFCLFVCDVYSP